MSLQAVGRPGGMRKDGLAFRSGAAILLAYDAASFITGRVIVVEGGFLASGVNQ